MTTLAAIQKQIADLQKQAEKMRKAEALTAATTARELIQRFGLTAEDVGLAAGSGRATKPGQRAKAKKATGVAKYRDPSTGKTWTGHGRAPGWIAGAKDRSDFAVAPDVGSPKAAKKRVGKAAAVRKADTAAAPQQSRKSASEAGGKSARVAAARRQEGKRSDTSKVGQSRPVLP